MYNSGRNINGNNLEFLNNNKDSSRYDNINIRDRSVERSTRLPKKLTRENIKFLKSLGFKVII